MRRALAIGASMAILLVLAAPARAALPGSNGLLAYGSVRGGEDLEIVVSRSDGRGARVLTDNAAFDICASWSPDGARLLFCRLGKNGFDLWVMNRDGSGQTNLTRSPGIDETFGSFSPDGSRIAYMHGDDSGLDIWVMDADGSGHEAVTSAPGDDWRPVWAPDGRSLLFERDTVGENESLESADVWTIDLASGRETQLTNFDVPAFFPDYSPDGERIVFSYDGDIAVMAADGSGVEVLTHDPRHETAPTFSPDGTRIAFIRFSESEDASDIFVMQADGGDLLRVTRTPGRESAPGWQPR